MAVAEKTKTPETKPQNPGQQLALQCLVEGLVIFVVLALMSSVIPKLWLDYAANIFNNNYLSIALLLIAVAAVGVGGILLVARMEGPKPTKGLRAGSVFMTLGFVLTAILFLATVSMLATQELGIAIAYVGAILVAAVVAFLFFWLVNQSWLAKSLLKAEENGWFHARGFKYNQGMKVRRATLVALLAVIAFGMFWAYQSKFFSAGDWTYTLPETGIVIPVLYQTLYTVPFLVTVILAWFAWRIINYPVFADFLIATEAEMNKVSWTTRKRLIQDTIVVLVTVVLFTLFLFLVDWLWIKLLSFPFPGVLQIDPQDVKTKMMAPKDW